jgi:hypothetical protein
MPGREKKASKQRTINRAEETNSRQGKGKDVREIAFGRETVTGRREDVEHNV